MLQCAFSYSRRQYIALLLCKNALTDIFTCTTHGILRFIPAHLSYFKIKSFFYFIFIFMAWSCKVASSFVFQAQGNYPRRWDQCTFNTLFIPRSALTLTTALFHYFIATYLNLDILPFSFTFLCYLDLGYQSAQVFPSKPIWN